MCSVSASTTAVSRALSVPLATQHSSRRRTHERAGLGISHLVLREHDDAARQRTAECAKCIFANRAQGETILPSLGRIDPPLSRSAARVVESSPPSNPSCCRRMPLQHQHAAAEIRRWPALLLTVLTAMPPPKTEAQIALERKLSGAVFSQRRAVPAGSADGHEAPPLPPGAACRRRRAAGEDRASCRRCCGPALRQRFVREVPAGAAPSAAEGCLHRLHSGNRDRLHAAGNDDLRDGDGRLRGRRQRGFDGARHQIGRRNPRSSAAGSGSCFCNLDRGAHARGRHRAPRFAGSR